MTSVAQRTTEWVDIVVDLLRSPDTDFPLETVGTALLETFESDVAALNWRKSNGMAEIRAVERPGFNHGGIGLAAATELMVDASNSALMRYHPLMRWNREPEGFVPQSLARVPAALCDDRRNGEILELLHQIGIDQQLGLPIAIQPPSHLVFSISRAGRGDYSDEDVETATRIQPLLIAVHWQKRVLGRYPMPGDAAKALNLTGREVAVLHLLATGRTSGAIAKALGCTGRTVEKHLEHLYRKLHVGDRVSALRVAEEESLIGVALPGPWEA